NFPFTKEFFNGVTLNSSLSESLKFQGDYVVASFLNEFESNLDYSEFEQQLQPVQPQFSNEPVFQKDFQMTLDENLINHFLMGLFYTKQTYSLTEFLLEQTPGNMKQISQMAANFFTSTIFAPLFPNIVREIGHGKRV